MASTHRTNAVRFGAIKSTRDGLDHAKSILLRAITTQVMSLADLLVVDVSRGHTVEAKRRDLPCLLDLESLQTQHV